MLRDVFMLFSSELKLPGAPEEGANDPPRRPMVALPPDSERAFRPVRVADSVQLPSAVLSSKLLYDRPSPTARCWIDVAENAELCPDAIELHLAAREECVSPVAIEIRDGGLH